MKDSEKKDKELKDSDIMSDDVDIFSILDEPSISEENQSFGKSDNSENIVIPKNRISQPPDIFEESYVDDETEQEEQEEPSEEEQQDEDEDYDFDFSLYESEDVEAEEIPESILQSKPPNVSGLRSRFSMGSFELDRLGELKKQCSSYAIKVAAYKQDINMLREYYGILRTIWMIIRPIYGSFQWNEFEGISKKCKLLLDSTNSSGKIKEDVFETLLTFDSEMQRLMQLSNLGFEVEKWGQGSRASKQITQ